MVVRRGCYGLCGKRVNCAFAPDLSPNRKLARSASEISNAREECPARVRRTWIRKSRKAIGLDPWLKMPLIMHRRTWLRSKKSKAKDTGADRSTTKLTREKMMGEESLHSAYCEGKTRERLRQRRQSPERQRYMRRCQRWFLLNFRDPNS